MDAGEGQNPEGMGVKEKKKITQGCSKRFPHFNGTHVIVYNDEISMGFYLLL